MPFRPVKESARSDWISLADSFERLLGGSESTRKAASYLRSLASNELPDRVLLPLPWHEAEPELVAMPAGQELPHPCVLAVLAPSVPLRAVWHRRQPNP